MTALNRFPRSMLRLIHGGLFVGQTTDGGRVEEELSSAQSRQARSLREPLIPANESANLPKRGVVCLKAEISRSEVKLLVVKGIIGNMHLAILTDDLSGSIDGHSRVVIDTGGSLFKQRSDDHYLLLFGNFAKSFAGGAGYSFRQFEEVDIFRLAKVLRAEELLQANNLCAFFGSLT